MLKPYDREIILEQCDEGDYGIMSPPLDAQKAVLLLCNYFLGRDWYHVDPVNQKQSNAIIVSEIMKHYRGDRKEMLRRKKEFNLKKKLEELKK